MTRQLIAGLVLLLAGATAAGAEVKTRVVDYKQGDTELQGMIAWDDGVNGIRPGVLVVHEWWGHNEHARNAARKLAAAGYVAFALDMYGKGKVTTHPDDAMKFMTEATKDPAVVAARFDAALAELKKDPHVDGTRIGAIGYCFGGGVVLEMARSGAPLKAVGTFHGSLAPAMPAKKGAVHAKLLVQTGDADEMIPPAQVEAFKKEMAEAGADLQVIVYPGAKHGFTNPDAGKAGMPQLAYDADADAKSWAALLDFFKKNL
jgi:dienelactone hydrolase